MKNSAIACVLLIYLSMVLLAAGCTSSSPAAGTGSAATTSAPSASTTPSCPDKLVWDGDWQSSYMGMAGNHDLSTAWTKYKDRPYGYEAIVKMTQTCWNVEGTLQVKGINCTATYKGTIDKNVLSGTWSGLKDCSKGMENRRFSLTMAADNKSWLGDMYDSSQDPAVFPPNWAGRRT